MAPVSYGGTIMTLAESVVPIDGPPAYDAPLPYKIADVGLADFGDKEKQL